MKTYTFITLLERALKDITLLEIESQELPYDPAPEDKDAPVGECLGFVLREDVHMAQVAARAMHILWTEASQAPDMDEADIDEMMGDFTDLMGGMKVMPYLQWVAAMFPYLTRAQYEARSESDEDPETTL